MPTNTSELKPALYLGKHNYLQQTFYFGKPIHILWMRVMASSIYLLPGEIRTL